MLAAIAMLRPGAAQGGFAIAGVAVEAVGLTMLFRAHRLPREDWR